MFHAVRRLSFWLPLGLLALANTADAAPERAGFTGDLSIGASVTTRTTGSASGGTNMPFTTSTSTVLEPGVAPLGVSLGGYFTPRIALLGRLAGTSYFRGGGSTQILHTFLGPVVEFWPHDRWFLAGGVGLGTLAPNPLFGPSVSTPRQGLAFDARAGAVLKGGVRHALTASLEIVPAIYNRFQIGVALIVAWKWY
jgi:hypothetical protein